jgi:hypothetical protein
MAFMVFMEENELQKFENREKMLEEIKSLFFKTLYL